MRLKNLNSSIINAHVHNFKFISKKKKIVGLSAIMAKKEKMTFVM
jgi:hypothetical protein